MSFWIRDKQEVEVVDFLIQVRESIVSSPLQRLTLVKLMLRTCHFIPLTDVHPQAHAHGSWPHATDTQNPAQISPREASRRSAVLPKNNICTRSLIKLYLFSSVVCVYMCVYYVRMSGTNGISSFFLFLFVRSKKNCSSFYDHYFVCASSAIRNVFMV